MRTKKEFPVSGIIDCDHFESASMAIRAPVFKQIGGFDPFWF
jgi:GT2 family glycosyltransferase